MSIDLDEVDCRIIESSSPSARHAMRSSISLSGSRRRLIVERRQAEEMRDWFRNAGRRRAVAEIESRLPQLAIRQYIRP